MIGINVYQKEEKELLLSEVAEITGAKDKHKKKEKEKDCKSVATSSEREETVWDNYYHRGGFPRSIFEILLNCLSEV